MGEASVTRAQILLWRGSRSDKRMNSRLIVCVLLMGGLAGACSDSTGSARPDARGAIDVWDGISKDGGVPVTDVSPWDSALGDSMARDSVALADGGDGGAFGDRGREDSTDGSTDPAACSGPENTASVVYETVIAEQPPLAKGGSIAPGLYHETAFLRYSSESAPQDAGPAIAHRLTARIDSDMKLAVSWDSVETGLPVVQLYQMSKRGAAGLDWAFICPAIPAIPQYEYDVSGPVLTLYNRDAAGAYAMILERIVHP